MTSNEGLYLTAEEAAERLGVSQATLYAYVSRKNIRSLQIEGSKKRRYWAEDIERIRKKPSTPKRRSGRSQTPSAQSAITLLTDTGLYYRGVDVLDLVEAKSVEEVAELLWQVPGAFDHELPRTPESTDSLLELYQGYQASEKAIALYPTLERANPRAFDLSPEGYARTGSGVVRWFAALVGGKNRPTDEPLHQYLVEACGVDPGYGDLLRRLMILSLDHELDHSTNTVRAAAMTGVTPFYAAITGLASYHGRRVAYGRAQTINQLLNEICTSADPVRPLLKHFGEKNAIPGFGDAVPVRVDTRVNSLLSSLDSCFGEDVEFQRLMKAAEVAHELVGHPPEFLLLATFVGRKFGLDGQELALVGVARMVGWIAHACEQYNTQPFSRERAFYTGELPG